MTTLPQILQSDLAQLIAPHLSDVDAIKLRLTCRELRWTALQLMSKLRLSLNVVQKEDPGVR